MQRRRWPPGTRPSACSRLLRISGGLRAPPSISWRVSVLIPILVLINLCHCRAGAARAVPLQGRRCPSVFGTSIALTESDGNPVEDVLALATRMTPIEGAAGRQRLPRPRSGGVGFMGGQRLAIQSDVRQQNKGRSEVEGTPGGARSPFTQTLTLRKSLPRLHPKKAVALPASSA